ncbi:hypothetical protein ACOME3_007376 [Neoechinorhynchus agilis]
MSGHEALNAKLQSIVADHSYSTHDVPHGMWDEYKAAYGKNYSSEEDTQRFQIFQTKFASIIDHNRRAQDPSSGVTFTMGLNHLTDATDQEMKSLCGFRRH